MRIIWDEPKRLANLAKYGLDFADLDGDFFIDSVVVPTKKGRLMAVNAFKGSIVSVIFAAYSTQAVSVISMRPASRKERQQL